MNKGILLLILLFFEISAICQPIRNYHLVGYKQERTGGASMNHEDGVIANNVAIDYLLFIVSNNSKQPFIKAVYINGFVASFKIVPIKNMPDFDRTTITHKTQKTITKNKVWQIVIDVLELPKTKHLFTSLTYKNDLIVVFKNNQKLVLNKISSIPGKVYE